MQTAFQRERHWPRERRLMPYHQCPTLSPLSAELQKKEKERWKRHFLGGRLNDRPLWTLASREKTTAFSPHPQIKCCPAFSWEPQTSDSVLKFTGSTYSTVLRKSKYTPWEGLIDKQRWKVTNYIYSRYCNWVAFLCTCTFLSNFFNL